MAEYVVYDPIECDYREFVDLDAAIEAANDIAQSYLDDGQWNEDVEGVFVAEIIARPVKKVLAARSDMTEAAWDRLTGGSDCDEWWDFIISGPVS